MPAPTPPTSLEEQFVTEAIPVGLPWRLLVFSLVIFGLSLSVFFGLKFGYAKYLDREGEITDKKIKDLAQQVKQEDQKRFINFYSQLFNLQKILDNHAFTANIFDFLERSTLGNVYYTDASFLRDGNIINLKGTAASSEAIVQQLNIFDKAPELARVVLDQMTFDQRGQSVGFSISAAFSDEFFKKPVR